MMSRMVRDGYFGFKDYFKSLCDTVEDGKDFYLLGYDFASYLEAQVKFSRVFKLIRDIIIPEKSNWTNSTESQFRLLLIELLLMKRSGLA